MDSDSARLQLKTTSGSRASGSYEQADDGDRQEVEDGAGVDEAARERLVARLERDERDARRPSAPGTIDDQQADGVEDDAASPTS